MSCGMFWYMLSWHIFWWISTVWSLTPCSGEVDQKLHHIQDKALYCLVSAMDCNVHPSNGTFKHLVCTSWMWAMYIHVRCPFIGYTLIITPESDDISFPWWRYVCMQLKHCMVWNTHSFLMCLAVVEQIHSARISMRYWYKVEIFLWNFYLMSALLDVIWRYCWFCLSKFLHSAHDICCQCIWRWFWNKTCIDGK